MFRHHGTATGIGVLGLAAVLTTVPLAAHGVTDDRGTFAEGRFLVGSVVDAGLDRVVSVEPATAFNDGTRPIAEQRNPFEASVAGAVTVDSGEVALTQADGVDMGLIGQYAIARDDGTSYASSGLLGANGAIGVSPAAGGTAVIDLAALLGRALPPSLTGLRLEAAGIAAEAEARLGDLRGGYVLADARLVLEVPAIAAAQQQARASAEGVQAALGSLGGSSGPLAGVVVQALTTAGLGALASVDVSIDADLDGVLAELGVGTLHDPALSVDLTSGVVTVDLASLPAGAGLNDLQPDTDLIGDGVVDRVVGGLHRLVDGYFGTIDARLVDAVRDARIEVRANASILDEVQIGETLRTIVTEVTQVVDAITGETLGTLDPLSGRVTSLTPRLSGSTLAELLVTPGGSGLLGSLLPSVTTRVVAETSTVAEPTFSTLESSADVLIVGTLAGLRGGTAVQANATATLLGAPVALDASVLVDRMADSLGSVLPRHSASGGALDDLSNAIAEISGIGDLVALRTNVQSIADDGAFTQTALRVQLLGGDLATIDLANATVGPNTMPGGAGGGTDPGPTLAAEGELAFTGFALWLMLLLGLGCITAGAIALWRSRSMISAEEAIDA